VGRRRGRGKENTAQHPFILGWGGERLGRRSCVLYLPCHFTFCGARKDLSAGIEEFLQGEGWKEQHKALGLFFSSLLLDRPQGQTFRGQDVGVRSLIQSALENEGESPQGKKRSADQPLYPAGPIIAGKMEERGRRGGIKERKSHASLFQNH